VTLQRWAAAVIAALGLWGCDTRVVIGYSPSPSPGSSPSAGRAAAAASDAGVLDAAAPDAQPAAGSGGREGGASGSSAGSGARDAAADEPPPRVSWPSGAHASSELPPLNDFAAWRARPLDLVHVFPDRTRGWDGIVEPAWPVEMFSSFRARLLISLPLYPEGQGNNQECASGAYDSEWRRLGSYLSERDRADSIIRLGWGPNDLNHPWRADADPSAWISCFQHTVTALRSTAPALQIDWSFNPIGAPNIDTLDPYATYPGDEYVDFIGLEAFDRYPASLTAEQWDEACNAATGLCNVIAFARQHGKKVGIAEWGVASCGSSSGGDNPFFIDRMVRTFAAHSDVLAYEAYFEDSGPEVCSSLSDAKQNPLASARYKQIYSAR
jgi:hypothetical protein